MKQFVEAVAVRSTTEVFIFYFQIKCFRKISCYVLVNRVNCEFLETEEATASE